MPDVHDFCKTGMTRLVNKLITATVPWRPLILANIFAAPKIPGSGSLPRASRKTVSNLEVVDVRHRPQPPLFVASATAHRFALFPPFACLGHSQRDTVLPAHFSPYGEVLLTPSRRLQLSFPDQRRNVLQQITSLSHPSFVVPNLHHCRPHPISCERRPPSLDASRLQPFRNPKLR